ncbi:MAG: esterase-like activity of phytase family protein [Kiloniellaceae bacterium]
MAVLPPRLSGSCLSGLCLALGLAAGLPGPGPARAADAIELSTFQRRLNPERPRQGSVGRLAWRGGVEITSDDPRIGGLSGLLVTADGRRMIAVSDQGHWLFARLLYDDKERLGGLDQGRIAPLRGLDGEPLVGKRWQDAESLAALADGSYLIGFERTHRIWRYPVFDPAFNARPSAWPAPPGLGQAPANGGLEALVVLADGAILAITEKQPDGADLAAYLWRGAGWSRLAYRRQDLFSPSGAARLPGGDIVVVERRSPLLAEPSVRLVRIPSAEIRSGARLEGREIARWGAPLIVDNFEGIAARQAADGKTLIYLLSDDNYSALQRTLLLMFELQD